MFIHVLSEAQKTSFFDLAQQMIVADGIVAEAEIAYLDRLYWEAGLTGRAALGDVNADVDLKVFHDRRSRFVIACELIIISIVDGEYHRTEAEFANNIIDQFQISPDDHAVLCSVAENAAQALVDMRNLLG